MKPIRHHLRNAFLPHAGNNFHPHALRAPWIHAFGGFIIAVKVVAIILVSVYSGQAHQASITPSSIVQLTNEARASHGLGTVRSNSALTKAAQAKANDMIAHQYFAHISPTKVTPWYWFSQAGYRYTSAGENLAIDYVSSEDVVAAWLASPSHRKNLLQAKYKDIGVAVATGEIHGVTSVIVVQMFGAPVTTVATVAPTPVKQTPNPTTTKKSLVAKPAVLGQTSPVRAVEPPTISSPASNTLVHGAPIFVGAAEAGSTLTIVEGTTLLHSMTVPSNGVFSITLQQELSDGSHTFTVTSTARGRQASSTVTLRIDQAAPNFDATQSLVLPSIVGQGIYDVRVAGSPDTQRVEILNSGETTALQKNQDTFIGQVTYRPSVQIPLHVRLVDEAQNSTVVPILDPRLYSAGVVVHHGPSYSAVQTIFFSRAFFTMFLVLMMVGMAVNVGMTWHRQHHPALLPTMLLVYLSGALLFL